MSPMIGTPDRTAKKPKVTLSDMREINNGFLKHEGLELSEIHLKHVVAHSNGEISDKELERRICGLAGDGG